MATPSNNERLIDLCGVNAVKRTAASERSRGELHRAKDIDAAVLKPTSPRRATVSRGRPTGGRACSRPLGEVNFYRPQKEGEPTRPRGTESLSSSTSSSMKLMIVMTSPARPWS
jgi:hypothetical protein